LIFRGAVTCPTTIAESRHTTMVATDMPRIARGQPVTASLDTYLVTKFLGRCRGPVTDRLEDTFTTGC
jgi:hypothetical protein